jgi:hypothetical protein
MGLKFTIAKLDEVPEAVRTMYKQEGNVFVLDVDGVVAKDKVDEFRNNNIQLQQQLDKLKHIDPEKYKELVTLDTQVREGELIKAGKLDEVVNLRVGEMKRTYETEKVSLTGQLSTANAQLAMLLIDNAVKNAAIKNGVVDTAVDDLVLRARSTYALEKGVPVAKDEKGNVIYGKDGATPMPIEDWMVGLKKTAPHLFRGSTGSGANGGKHLGAVDMSKLTPSQKISFGISQGGLVGKLPTES